MGPAGSRAASAGTFLTLAAHVAAMAPATDVGHHAHMGDGSDIPDDLGDKVLADTIATITAIAEERGRPVDWAVSTVEEAASYTVDQALAAGAIDLKAGSIDDLLAQADGRTVEVAGRPVTLDVAGATLDRAGMNPLQGFLHLLSDPNIAFILFTLGFYGLFFELQNPNWVTGILGAFAIILAFIGFRQPAPQHRRAAACRPGPAPLPAGIRSPAMACSPSAASWLSPSAPRPSTRSQVTRWHRRWPWPGPSSPS